MLHWERQGWVEKVPPRRSFDDDAIADVEDTETKGVLGSTPRHDGESDHPSAVSSAKSRRDRDYPRYRAVCESAKNWYYQVAAEDDSRRHCDNAIALTRLLHADLGRLRAPIAGNWCRYVPMGPGARRGALPKGFVYETASPYPGSKFGGWAYIDTAPQDRQLNQHRHLKHLIALPLSQVWSAERVERPRERPVAAAKVVAKSKKKVAPKPATKKKAAPRKRVAVKSAPVRQKRVTAAAAKAAKATPRSKRLLMALAA